MKIPSRFFPVALLAAALLLQSGCGGGSDGKRAEGEDEQIANVVSTFQGAAEDPRWFAAAFAQGAAPGAAQRKLYLKHAYALNPANVSVSGDSANGQVEILDHTGEKELKRSEWTFVKEGGQWKIKAAPL